MFLDTGIGADSYSIIELKMIDEIITNKEGSRRNLFEEASGISKYKLRKKQTFNKLKGYRSRPGKGGGFAIRDRKKPENA